MNNSSPSTANLAAIGLGANLERPQEMIAAAIAGLSGLPETRVTAKSRLYLSRPQGGPPGQDWYHNGVILLTTGLAPLALLKESLAVENRLGRVRRERWGPRTIDLDLLFYDATVLNHPDLTLPHPRLAERIFVLAPLNEVAPDWRHPLAGLTVGQMLAALPPELYEGLKPLGPLEG